MLRFKFNRLYSNLEIRIKEEKKIDSSWLMGFVQGLGRKKLSGYQFSALVDLLLVHPEPPEVPAAPDVHIPKSDNKSAAAGNDLMKTLAQR